MNRSPDRDNAPNPSTPVVLLAAGGTGGHLFPAEALAEALMRRNVIVDLATDYRAERYGKEFPARQVHLITSATLRSRNPFSLARTLFVLAAGTGQALRLLARIEPAAVVGFGGYPTLPPIMAATVRRTPTVIHEQNAVIGRANRLLAHRVTAIALSFAGMLEDKAKLKRKSRETGNPVRANVIKAAAKAYPVPGTTGPLRIVVFGGSQGARIMADVVPQAIERLDDELRRRLRVTQQAREEDLSRVQESYARAGVAAEAAPFFSDLPERIADAHLIVARSGASTVAELTAIGRPAILVPLPHALDQDQSANAAVLQKAGGAIRLQQHDFTPDRLAREITGLASAPQRLLAMAAAARSQGKLDAAERLADLVMETLRVSR
jgi:UDP-N-acetylglucosamine--N-acetylmuramyl-(pentapeptide) pyrophosphoryl-undecaprenol N-acetylglucosamine transferase